MTVSSVTCAYPLPLPATSVVSIAFLIFIAVDINEFKILSKASRQTKDVPMIGRRTIELIDKGICGTTELSARFLMWAAVDNVTLHSKNVSVFFDNTLALIVPSSSFVFDEDRNNFV